MDPRARAVYRVDVRSFFDTDADGLGDINGIEMEEHTSELQSL